MGRPPLVDRDNLLQSAREIALERGAAAVTAAAVAARLGRPSGSLYHRFASRDHLLAETWLDAVASFQAGYLSALDADDVPGAARHVVAWSRQQPARAALLTAFRRTDLLGSSWPPEVADRVLATYSELERAIRACARRLAVPPAFLLAAAVDLPYGVVRRKLLDGTLTKEDERVVHRAAGAILGAAS